MTKIATLDGGMSYHTRTLREGEFSRFFGPIIRLPDLATTDLSALPVLLIPCRTNGEQLAKMRALLADYVEAGGFLVVMGETRPDLFLDGVTFHPVPTNFWWWLEGGADLGVRVCAPDHPLMAHLSQADLSWHVHGTLQLAEGGTPLAQWQDERQGGPILIDSQRGKGRLMLTTLDPIYHHGSGFMPATTRFLEAFLPWLSEQAEARAAGRS